MADFKRDFETDEQYRQRIAEPLTVETDLGKVLDDELPSPWIVDMGPMYETKADREWKQRQLLRAPRGTPTHRMTDEQAAQADQDEGR
jgi:hypothetical protein